MSNLRPGVLYKREFLQGALNQEEATRLMNLGYVLQHDVLADQYRLVHMSKAASVGFSGTPRSEESSPFHLDPLKRRSGMEKRNSLIDKWVDDIKATGTIPGLTDEKVSEILGEPWVTGVSVVTGDTVMKVAEYFLQDAENKQNEIERKKVTEIAY